MKRAGLNLAAVIVAVENLIFYLQVVAKSLLFRNFRPERKCGINP